MFIFRLWKEYPSVSKQKHKAENVNTHNQVFQLKNKLCSFDLHLLFEYFVQKTWSHFLDLKIRILLNNTKNGSFFFDQNDVIFSYRAARVSIERKNHLCSKYYVHECRVLQSELEKVQEFKLIFCC